MEELTLFSYQICVLSFGFLVGIGVASLIWLLYFLKRTKFDFILSLGLLFGFSCNHIVNVAMGLGWGELFLAERLQLLVGFGIGAGAIAFFCHLFGPTTEEFIQQLLKIKQTQQPYNFQALNIRRLKSLASLNDIAKYGNQTKPQLIKNLQKHYENHTNDL